MNELKLGWIDYSSEHREKVMAVLDALAEPGAVDELGIGRIRDGFADLLFPGTSTIQTRAKYFLIVPYLLMELEKERFKNPEDLLEKLSTEELALIEPLKEEAQDGVIGNRAGAKLKRKPSGIYWNGLRTFNIFRHESLSLTNYAKMVFRKKHHKSLLNNYGNEELDVANMNDDSLVSTFWKCILPNADWKQNISMYLTFNEAQFLKSQIITAPKSKDSLLAHLLNTNYSKWAHIDAFEDLTTIIPDEGPLRNLYNQANQFSKFLHGAHIRYNIIAAGGKNEAAVNKWRVWINSPFVNEKFATFPFKRILHDLNIHNSRLHLFLANWQKAVLSGEEAKMDDLIIRREIELKSPNRAKLQNSRVYHYEDGDWIGNDKLSYRYQDAKVIVEDIVTGLGEQHAKAR